MIMCRRHAATPRLIDEAADDAAASPCRRRCLAGQPECYQLWMLAPAAHATPTDADYDTPLITPMVEADDAGQL